MRSVSWDAPIRFFVDKTDHNTHHLSVLQGQETIGDKAVNTLTVNIALDHPDARAIIEDVQLFDRALSAEELPGIAGIPAGTLTQPAAENPLLGGAGVGSESAAALSDAASTDDASTPERDGETTVSATKYYFLNGLRVAKVTGGVYTWIHSDHLHSATILTDETGAEVRRLAYRAFGEELENTGSGSAPAYSYTGKERDATGLMYYGARYYDPALARFITPDTIYDRGPQGLNRYSYALNNPIRYNDPSGHGVIDLLESLLVDTFSRTAYGTPTSNPGLEMANEELRHAAYQLEPPKNDAGLVEGSIPVWGDAKDSYFAMKEGKILYATLYGMMALNDVFDGGVSPEDAAKAGVRSGKELAEKFAGEGLESGGNFIFRGDKFYRGGHIGVLISGEIDATAIIKHIQGKKKAGTFTSFTTKFARGTKSHGAKFFADKVIKVGQKELSQLESLGNVRILTPGDVYDILSNHAKKKIRDQANNIRRTMLKNNEVLIQGQIPEELIKVTR